MLGIGSKKQRQREAFVQLLERQQAGDAAAVGALRQLKPEPEHDFWLRLLWNEWSGAFSYEPGRAEALAPLCGLARKLLACRVDKEFEPYAQPEWSVLIELKGPADCILVRACDRCGRTLVGAGMSGFLDEVAWICRGCGDFCFKAIYNDAPPPACQCGASFVAPSLGCPDCGHAKSRDLGSMSPYEYFGTHRYTTPDRS
jgi:hypothetical protein